MAETGRAPAKKAPAKKTSAKKAQTRKAPAKKSAPQAEHRPDGARRSRGVRVALDGAQQLVELTGKEFEGVVGITKDDDGWTVQVEVLEMRRIPSTTDVLAVYEVALDADGDLLGYRRADRYVRGSAGEDRS